jgi:Cytochrome P460
VCERSPTRSVCCSIDGRSRSIAWKRRQPLDPNGTPVKDGSGRFSKTELKAFRVMEKRTGWGSEYPANKRNGEWEYQAFLVDGRADARANLDSCFQCHKNGDSANFMLTAAQPLQSR